MEYANRRFTSEEVSAVVRRALIAHQDGSDAISYEDLEDIARQSGIAESQLRQAIAEEDRLRALEDAKDQWRTRRKSSFFRHLRTYCIVNGCLLLIPGSHLWVVWPVVGWGIGLAFDARGAFFADEGQVEREAQRILEKTSRS